MTSAPPLTFRIAHRILDAAVLAVSLVREIRHNPRSDEECETEGLPIGSTYRCAHALPSDSQPWWRVDAWVCRDASGEDSLRIDVLGHSLEVFFIPKRAQLGLVGAP